VTAIIGGVGDRTRDRARSVGARECHYAQIGGSMSRRIERVSFASPRPRNTFASETRRGGGGGDCVHGRLISKAIVCKSGGNFVTATISVIKRTSLSLA